MSRCEYSINGKWSAFQAEVMGSNPIVRKKVYVLLILEKKFYLVFIIRFYLVEDFAKDTNSNILTQLNQDRTQRELG